MRFESLPATLRPNRIVALSWAMLFAAHALAVAILAGRHTLIPDENAYINLAQNLAETGSFHVDFPCFWHEPGQPFTLFGPGWPALLSVGYAIAGMTGCWVVMWVVWCANSVLAYDLGRVLALPVRGRWLIALWLSANPLLLFYHGHLMTECALFGYNLALAALAIRLLRRPDWRLAALFGAVAAAAHLTRGQSMLIVVGFFLTALFALRVRDLMRVAAVFAVVHLALVGPWLLRMERVGASPTAVECKMGINLYQYSGAANPDLYGPNTQFEMPPGIEAMTPGERDRVLTRISLRAIAADPSMYLGKCWNRVFLLFAPTPNFYNVSVAESVIVSGSTAVFFYVPMLAAIIGLVRRRGRWGTSVWFLVATLVVWYGFHIALNASIRNRLPSDAFVFALALWAWMKPASGPPHSVEATIA